MRTGVIVNKMASETIVGEIKNIAPLEWRWTLRNCNQYFKNSVSNISSPKFAIDQHNQTTHWQLYFYPSSKRGKTLVVGVTNFDEVDVIASVQFSISKEDAFGMGNQLSGLWPANKLIFSRQLKPDSMHCDFKTQYMIISDNNHLNTLELDCWILVYPESVLEQNNKLDRLALLEDFEKLFDNSKHSDVIFTFPYGKRIYAHKAILSTRSPVFGAMFEHDMKENRLNEVPIDDTKYTIMKELLLFIYAGKVENIEAICMDLLVAADKYGVEGLKVLCEKTICEQLNVDSALEILQLAIMYNTTVLQSKVYGYIAKNIQNIRQKPEFKQIDPEIKDKIIEILANSR